MDANPILVEQTRGDAVENRHRGAFVIADADGNVIAAGGDISRPVFPRSAIKSMQALAMVTSGAIDRFGLSDEQLALACASHHGEEVHVTRVAGFLGGLGLSETNLECGAHQPTNGRARVALRAAGLEPTALHNNCSGKHSGFLTLNRHLDGGTEYVELDHPVQQAAKAAYEDTTGETSAGWGIDGCSAPNFATTLTGFARALAAFAGATDSGDARQRAMVRLRQAMASHPELVSGEGGACTELMRAMQGRVTIKGGAEGVYAAILPEQGLGIALKIVDGSERAKEAAIAALLVRAGVLEAGHPTTQRVLNAPQLNRRRIVTGILTTAPAFP